MADNENKSIHPDYSMNIASWLLLRMVTAGNIEQVRETLKSVYAADIHTTQRDADKLAELCDQELQRRHPERGGSGE